MENMAWDHAKLMAVTGQSSSVVSQWLGKGSKLIKSIGKMEAAEAIERESGYSALWVAKGLGPKFRIHVPANADLRLGDRGLEVIVPPPATIAASLSSLGERLAKADPETRLAVAGLLAQYAKDPDQGRRIAQAIQTLLGEDEPDDSSAG